jgi:hypothetical protein
MKTLQLVAIILLSLTLLGNTVAMTAFSIAWARSSR